MMLFTLIRQALQEIWAHKFRTLLSMTGIILGVASLVSMIGVVQGMVKNFTVFFEQSGGIERVQVVREDPPEEQRELAFLSPGLNLDDIEVVQSSVPLAQYVAGGRSLGWMSISHGPESRGNRVRAVSPDYAKIDGWPIAQGRFISDVDEMTAAQVAVIGSDVVEYLFPDGREVLGERILVGRVTFTVVGVLENFFFEQGGRNALAWRNRNVFVPLTTGLIHFRTDQLLDELLIKVAGMEDLAGLVPQVTNALLISHNGINDFRVDTREDQLQEFKKLERSFTFSLGGVAAISLLVGGIGIMNVMLAVISERIREIGVRKAVGARGGDIFLQFLTEAILISLLGGLLGVLLSMGLLDLLVTVIPGGENIDRIPLHAMAFGFSFSVVVGVLAGVYPALKAARLDPIDALRYE